MQIRRQSHRVQLVAYRGYDKEKRRAITEQIGSLDSRTLEDPKPANLLDLLTPDQRIELDAWIADRRVEDAIRLIRLIPDIRLGELELEIKRRRGL